MTAWTIFLDYKVRVPVRGAILLNHDMDEVVLVKGWKKGANWSFPRGKINKNEKDLDCAIREVYEETGFDVREANLVPDEDKVKSIEISMREQHMQLFVFRDVPQDTHFEPRTRKEISKIEWYKLSDLPTLKKNRQDDGLAVVNANKFYMVAPFLGPLKKWIVQQKKLDQKTQAAVESEGYSLAEENGAQTEQAALSALPQAVPSDLPEVTSTTQDASSHLKRLLNIGGVAQIPTATQPEEPIKTSMVDRSKSNALLALLQQGSQHVSRASNVVSASPSQQNAPTVAQAPHLAPNFFPGFPQQQAHPQPSTFVQQTSTQPYNLSQNGHIPSAHHPTNQLELSASPSVQQVSSMQVPGSQSQQHVTHMNRHALSGQAQAPFQQTGDPQFSQQSQPAQSMGAVVPHASKLPPPKLNNHSRALLGFFKPNASPSPSNTQPATLAVQGSAQPRKTSHHQDSLLNLFKTQPADSTPQPVELSGNPVPPSSAAPTGVQILQRAVPQAPHQSPMAPSATKRNPSSATVSGHLNMPQFEATSKSSPKRGPHGSGNSRKGRFDQRAHHQTQQPASPITILPRPQSAKRDPSTTGPSAQSAQSHTVPTQAPEPVKPFQPQQILRRSEKTGYEDLMGAPQPQQAVNPEPAVEAQTAELAPQTTFDRRPSQNSAQKEALLSLFGKQGLSSPSPVPQHVSHTTATNQSAAAVSGLVSPLSSRQFPSSGESLSRHGTPSETDMVPNRISSPNDKAFLLGYLQNVAKGSQ